MTLGLAGDPGPRGERSSLGRCRPPGWWRQAVPVMGTVVSFAVLPGPGGLPTAARAVAEAGALLQEVDRRYSLWRPQSPLSRFRRGAASLDQLPDEVAAELAAILELCLVARRASGGWFDPWAAPGGVDPTGLVKGWAVEQALAPLVAAPVAAAVVNAGGDAVVFGGDPEAAGVRFGVAHPWRPDGLACVVRVQRAIATSGSGARGAHFFDPLSGARTRGAVAQATVVGSSLALADALATALVVGGLAAFEHAARFGSGTQAYLIGFDGRERWTPGFPFEAVHPSSAEAHPAGRGEGPAR